MSRKVKSIKYIDTFGSKTMIQFKFTEARENSNRLLGTNYCDRARLLYNKDAKGSARDPHYELITVIATEIGQPRTSTENKWYEDEPLVVPMNYIHNNLV